jgi:transcriptional regulator of arginine metabolism
MKRKTQRLLTIRRIIDKEKIRNQEEMLARLLEEGYELTQATLSRDLKFLQVIKMPDKKLGYYYSLPVNQMNNSTEANSGDLQSFPLRGFKSLEFANNLGVIKTIPGYASSIASLIDSMDKYEILGTIAGDDTILLIPNEGVSHQDIMNAMVFIMPELEEKLYNRT